MLNILDRQGGAGSGKPRSNHARRRSAWTAAL